MPDGGTSSSLLAGRYRDAVPPATLWNPVIETMLAHRSVRAYTEEALPPGTLETLVAAAQSASTSSNLQAWSVVAVQDQARRQRLAVLAGNQKQVARAPLVLCFVADLSRAARVGERAGQDLAALPFFECFLLAAMDAAIAAQNAAVAAESLGLGTCYIGGLRNHPEELAAELALPPHAFVTFGLTVGHPDPARPADIKPRLPQPAILHHEQYQPDDAAPVAAFHATLTGFQAEQGMKPQGWSDLILARLGPVEGLSGRDRLHAALLALGFGLR